MATLRVMLTFPQELVREPVIYTVAKTYRLVPNIRKARVTETSGKATLDLSGAEEDLKRGMEHLTRLGVKVKPISRAADRLREKGGAASSRNEARTSQGAT